MTRILRWMLPFISGFLIADSRAQTSHVEWRSPDFPPFFLDIGAGEYGIFDRLHLEVVAALPNYTHRYQGSNYARLLYDMEQGRRLCSHALFKTSSRMESVVFSRPILPILPPGLIFKAGTEDQLRPFIDTSGRLNLRRLIETASIRLGYVRGRTYGEAVDQLVRPDLRIEGDAPRLASSRSSRLMFNMLEANRVDVVLAYSSEAQYFTRGAGGAGRWKDQRLPELHFLPLAEQPDFLYHYYGCTRGDWGATVIADVDRVLDRAAIQQMAADLYASTLLPSSLPRFREIYEHYLERGGKAEPGSPSED